MTDIRPDLNDSTPEQQLAQLTAVLREHYGDSAAVNDAPAAVAVALITAQQRTITKLVDEHRRALADLDTRGGAR